LVSGERTLTHVIRGHSARFAFAFAIVGMMARAPVSALSCSLVSDQPTFAMLVRLKNRHVRFSNHSRFGFFRHVNMFPVETSLTGAFGCLVGLGEWLLALQSTWELSLANALYTFDLTAPWDAAWFAHDRVVTCELVECLLAS
jgi:hypothetical protein